MMILRIFSNPDKRDSGTIAPVATNSMETQQSFASSLYQLLEVHSKHVGQGWW